MENYIQVIHPSINEKDEYDYKNLLQSIQRFAEKKFETFGIHLFNTDATGLFDIFLSEISVEKRQYYTCNACRHFIEQYGSLVFITQDGTTVPLLWSDFSESGIFTSAVNNCLDKVRNAKVTGVFFSDKDVWGIPVTGKWNHLSLTPPRKFIKRSLIKNASQLTSEKQEDFRLIFSALSEYDKKIADMAVQILKTGSLDRSEKILGMAEWFADLCSVFDKRNYTVKKRNFFWLAVAKAPAGFCHIRTSVIGTLFDDLKKEVPFDEVRRRFNEKMDSTQYQRPSAPPSGGNIDQAEVITEKLGIKKSLERRFARIDEIPLIWKPREIIQEVEGVFGHLKTVKDRTIEIPLQKITWVRFRDIILSTAESIEYYVCGTSPYFSGIVTAADMNAPPIIRWDLPEKRNPFSWFFYQGTTTCSHWNLSPGYTPVTGITLSPDGGKGVFFIIKDCKDSNYKTCGNALFPENLRSELHSVRKTIEAYSKKAILGGYEEASVCGVFFMKQNRDWNTKFMVRVRGIDSVYHIDRWE